MIVFSHDKWSEAGEFDPIKGTLNVNSRKELGLNGVFPLGHFTQLYFELCLFYRYKEDLWLRIGEECFNFSKGYELEWGKVSPQESILKILLDGKRVKDFKYAVVFADSIQSDGTMWEPEHSDFGLFVYNVMKDPARQSRIYKIKG